MKSLEEFVNESSKDEFNEHIKSHQQCYNKLLKWYDSCVGKYMNKDEAISCMKYAITQWENDNFDDM